MVYVAPGKLIACFEGSHVNVSATAAKKVKEIHVDDHKAIMINSKYSIHKVGKLKDMPTRKIKIQLVNKEKMQYKQEIAVYI